MGKLLRLVLGKPWRPKRRPLHDVAADLADVVSGDHKVFAPGVVIGERVAVSDAENEFQFPDADACQGVQWSPPTAPAPPRISMRDLGALDADGVGIESDAPALGDSLDRENAGDLPLAALGVKLALRPDSARRTAHFARSF